MLRTRIDDRTDRVAVMPAAIVTFCLAMTAAIAQAGTVLYVDDSAPLGGDGQAWVTAYRYLQDALAAAQPGSGVEEIRVGQGVYEPDQDEGGNVTPCDREASFVLIDGVALVGGYAGYGAADPDARDIQLFETILTGDLLGDDEPDFMNREDNTYQITNGSGTEATAELDGFTVTGGYAAGDAPWDNGAGMYNDDGSPTVRCCVFIDNWAADHGSGIYNFEQSCPTVIDSSFIDNVALDGGTGMIINTSAMISGCTFSGNSSPDSGGAVKCVGHGSPTFVDCVFEDNFSGESGGAIFLYFKSTPIFENCTFAGNVAQEYGGAIYACNEIHLTCTGSTFSENTSDLDGGAVVLWNDSIPSLTDCRFLNNKAENGHGGAILYGSGGCLTLTDIEFAGNIAYSGGAIFNTDESQLVCMDCSFVGNYAGAGGALFSDDDAVTVLRNCTLYQNAVWGFGGAVFQRKGSATLINSTLCNNSAGTEGGGIAIDSCSARIYNCTFAYNEAEYGGGVFNEQQCPVMANCIIWGNSATYGAEIYGHTAWITFHSCDIQGCGSSGNGWDADLGHDGGGNIDADPLYVEPGVLDYRLPTGSPCVDAGVNSVLPRDLEDLDGDGLDCERFPIDLDGNARFSDDPDTADTGCGLPIVVDIGAYEFAGVGENVVYGDVDGSGMVDIDDIFDVLWGWGPCHHCRLGDVNGDFVVNIDDIFSVLGNWGPCE